MNTEQLINQLCLPQSYPHPVEVITTIETHISVVFLTGQYAYKLKKPVNFGFLNFTHKHDRRHFCQQELRLNRRTAPDLYIDVVPIVESVEGGITVASGISSKCQPESLSCEPIDYLVKMHQFEPNWVLGRYLCENEVTPDQERQVAQRIAQLHLTSETVKTDSPLGDPEAVLQPMLDNFPTLIANCSEDYQVRLTALLAWTKQRFYELRLLLVKRKQGGFIRECHGDLHLDNIALIDDQPTLFDGIEFNDTFRWIDGLNDLAFLLIDLEFRQQHGFKRRLLSEYLAITGDYNGLALLDFYQVYRSLVRAKISALRLNQLQEQPKKSAEFQYYKQITMQYIHQAENEAFNRQAPQVILLQGVSGSGKSHLSKQLQQQIEAIVIRSDIERKRLFSLEPTDRVSGVDKQRLYSAKLSQKTYQRLQKLTEQLLQIGLTVIVDATFLKEEHRQPFYELAKKMGRRCKTLYIQADEQTAKRSIEYRLKLNNDPSDADVEVMQQQLKVIEPPSLTERSLTLNASELRRFFPGDLIQDFLL